MSQWLNEDPKRLVQFLAYGSAFADFPKTLNFPGLSDPNYVPPDKSKSVLIWVYSILCLSTIAVGMRLYIRAAVKAVVFGWDDWLIIPGQVWRIAERHALKCDPHDIN